MEEYNSYATLEELLRPYHIPQKEIDKYKVSGEEIDDIVKGMIDQLVFSKAKPTGSSPKMSIIGRTARLRKKPSD